MSDPNEVAKAKVTVKADLEPLKRDINEAKVVVEGLGDAGDEAGKKTEESMEGAAKSTDSLSSSLGKATGVAGALIAAVTGVANAYKAIANYVKNGETLASLFLVDQDSVNSTEQALESINKRVIEVGAELEKKNRGGIGSLTGRLKSQIESELKTLTDSQLSISRQVKAQRKQALKEELDNARDIVRAQMKAMNDEFEFSLLPEEDQIDLRAIAARKALTKAAKEAGISILDAELAQSKANISKIAQAKIDSNRKIAEEKHQRELELDKKRAEAIAKAVESALAPVLASLSTSFGSGFTTKLDTIITEVTEATSALRDMR